MAEESLGIAFILKVSGHRGTAWRGTGAVPNATDRVKRYKRIAMRSLYLVVVSPFDASHSEMWGNVHWGETQGRGRPGLLSWLPSSVGISPPHTETT